MSAVATTSVQSVLPSSGTAPPAHHTYAIIPNKQLCQYYQLGTTVNQCIHNIRTQTQSKHNNIVFDLHNDSELVVQCTELNTTLYFDNTTQQCHYIVYKLQPSAHIVLQYKQAVIHSDTNAPTFTHCYNNFGPTHSGVYDSAQHTYTLTYPGIKLVFAIDSDSNASNYTIDTLFKLNCILSEVHIYYGYDATLRTVPPVAETDYYFEPVNVHINNGIYLCKHNVAIQLHTTTMQDILADLGQPTHTQQIAESLNKLNIHSPFNVSDGNHNSTGTLCYTYTQYGLDILFNSLHTVNKIVLHSNLVNTVNFGIYNRCNWRIVSSNGRLLTHDTNALNNDTIAQQLVKSSKDDVSEHKDNGAEHDNQPSSTIMDVLQTKQSKKDKRRNKGQADSRTPSQSPPADITVPTVTDSGNVTASSNTDKPATTNGVPASLLTCSNKWCEVESHITSIKSDPIVHGSNTIDPQATNPFGSLLLYSCRGLVAAVVSSTQRVDTLTLFADHSVYSV